MSTRRHRRSGLEVGKLMYRARRDRAARDLLDALTAEQAGEQAVSPPEEPRTPRPDPTQGCRSSSVRATGVDRGREMYAERRRPPSYDPI